MIHVYDTLYLYEHLEWEILPYQLVGGGLSNGSFCFRSFVFLCFAGYCISSKMAGRAVTIPSFPGSKIDAMTSMVTEQTTREMICGIP